jgi:nitrite reductase/ring-hydroxylating ferredoxin subunit
MVPPGYGAVVHHGLKKIAVYCDDAGRLHERSAVCPHLGGIVAWNHSEKTWDCPCHGSRFDRLGKVVNGPANSNLSPIEDTPAQEHNRAHCGSCPATAEVSLNWEAANACLVKSSPKDSMISAKLSSN